VTLQYGCLLLNMKFQLKVLAGKLLSLIATIFTVTPMVA